MKKKVLIIEDDKRLSEMLALHLAKLGGTVCQASDGEQGLELIGSHKYDLIILDITLPGISGLEVCRKIRADDKLVRILMLTALSDELDLIVGLETGADDYVGKPFKVGELIARVQALLRRADLTHATNGVEQNDQRHKIERVYRSLKINIERRKIYIHGQEVEFTAREYDLLVFLSASPGRAYTRRQILQNVWGSEVMAYDHSINTIIKRLRKKIEANPRQPDYIQTVRGIGYRFAETC